MEMDKPTEIRWDPKKLVAERPKDIGKTEEDGIIDYARETKSNDPEDKTDESALTYFGKRMLETAPQESRKPMSPKKEETLQDEVPDLDALMKDLIPAKPKSPASKEKEGPSLMDTLDELFKTLEPAISKEKKVELMESREEEAKQSNPPDSNLTKETSIPEEPTTQNRDQKGGEEKKKTVDPFKSIWDDLLKEDEEETSDQRDLATSKEEDLPRLPELVEATPKLEAQKAMMEPLPKEEEVSAPPNHTDSLLIPVEAPLPTDGSPSESFWEECDKGENKFGKPWELPASPKNKKKNHARRDRRLATQRRLSEEKKKEEARKERLQKREEHRARRRANPKPPRTAHPEDPVRIQLTNNHWRLPRRSDLGTYVIRKLPGKIRRVWVQPCWAGKCSPRKSMNQQAKRDVIRFLRCAIKVQAPEKIDGVHDFLENPYFLRPKQLLSWRAIPEAANTWKVEDDIESSKGTGKWSSVADRIKRRKREGKKLCKKFGRDPPEIEEISYLTVNCDFQEVPPGLPKTERQRFPDKGLQFVTEAKEIIEGPKTQEETEEKFRIEQRMLEYMRFHEQFQVKAVPKKENPSWKSWTPRWEDIEGEDWELTPVTVQILKLGDTYNWKLREDLEWQDFRFLVNSKLGHNR
jgi:hypothetical protein